jgi:hypothetical protein
MEYTAKFVGIISQKRPLMPILFEVPFFHCSKIIYFLIDTGSSYSAITEKEAMLAGINYFLLPDYRKDCIGFGGTFKNKIINSPVHLTFGSDDNLHKITFGGGFQIVCIPENVGAEERETLLRYTPSVIGMDILCQFRLYLDKKKVELSL